MSRGERTRETILERAAVLFNQRGFAGTSLSDLMKATSLEKGSIYHFFGGKNALALAALDHAAEQVGRRLNEARDRQTHAVDRLTALVQTFRRFADDPPVAGGCPIVNTAVEADDTHPALRDRAREVMDGLRERVTHEVREGAARGEVRPDVDAEALATVMVSILEGALVLSRLYEDPVHLDRAARHLVAHLEREVRAP